MMLIQLFASLALIASTSAFCPNKCLCFDGEVPTVDCTDADLKHVPIMLNPRLRSLNLRGNEISAIGLDELSMYTDLEYLDLGRNRILTIDRGAFYRLTQLKALRLDDNLLASLQVDMFVGLHQLKVLDLSSNGFERVPTSAFSDLRQLEMLNLSRNSISEMSPGSLTGLSHLKELDLEQNSLSAIPKIALHATRSLRKLNLAQNRLTVLWNNSFHQLQELESLDLAYNSIEAVTENAFFGLRNLRRLDLQTNMLYHVPTLSFRFLHDLEWLRLSGNPLAELPTSAFEGLARLQTLIITHCPLLQYVLVNAFSGLYQLKVLYLSSNPRLRLIDPLAFERDTELNQLFLHSNNLTSLAGTLLNWDHLSILDLRKNPWDCNCELAWLPGTLNEIYQGTPLYPEELVCAAPRGVQGLPLTQLDSDAYLCGGSIALKTVILTLVTLGLSFVCLIAALILVISNRERLAAACSRFLPWAAKSSTKSLCYEQSQTITSCETGTLDTKNGSKWNCYYYTEGMWVPSKHERQSFMATSDYYSSASHANSTISSVSSVSRDNSFRVLAHYPVPITEL